MDYSENAKMQAGAAYLGGGLAKDPPPHRTLDAIAGATGELRDMNARIEAALDRLGHERCEQDCAESGAGLQIVGPNYSRSLRQLDAQISTLRSNIAALESHI